MDWSDVCSQVDEWTEKLAGTALAVRLAAAEVITPFHVGYYINADTDHVGLYAHPSDDLTWCKQAVDPIAGSTVFLSYQDLADPDGHWVKVAYSPTLRRAGELLNFFPGQYPGGIPNSPSPLAAMLTSGLLGAGLGWGSGKLIGAMLPRQYGKRLGRTGALLGSLAGASPGLVWGLGNLSAGNEFNDPKALSPPAGSPPEFPPPGGELPDTPEVQNFLGNVIVPRIKRSLDDIALGSRFKRASETFAASYARPPITPLDVNINAVGQTLWEHDAAPALTASTMGTLYAAQQLPDPNSRPGWATGQQLGQLAANATGDYFRGLLVGAALNQIVGTPFRASTYGLGNVAVGLIGAVVPKLFGR